MKQKKSLINKKEKNIKNLKKNQRRNKRKKLLSEIKQKSLMKKELIVT